MRLAKTLLVLVFGGFSILAAAGAKDYYPVTISLNVYAPPGTATAYANLADARGNEQATGEYLACYAYQSDYIYCDARNSAGTWVGCDLTPASPVFQASLALVRGIKGTSFVQFMFDPNTYSCTDLRVSNGSNFMPLTPGAGSHYTTSVGANYAFAVLSSARHSSSPQEFLQCDAYASGFLDCVAQDAAGHFAWCSTTTAANPAFRDNLLAIDGSSSVNVRFGSNGICDDIILTNGSQFIP
jgi:hypothetical protein